MTTSMVVADTRSMSTEDEAGRLAIGIWYRTVWWAVDELVAKLPPEQLRKLRVRAGEHLAAILTTTFLRTAPTEVDTEGGVDLWFDLSHAQEPLGLRERNCADGRDGRSQRPMKPRNSVMSK